MANSGYGLRAFGKPQPCGPRHAKPRAARPPATTAYIANQASAQPGLEHAGRGFERPAARLNSACRRWAASRDDALARRGRCRIGFPQPYPIQLLPARGARLLRRMESGRGEVPRQKSRGAESQTATFGARARFGPSGATEHHRLLILELLLADRAMTQQVVQLRKTIKIAVLARRCQCRNLLR